MKSKLTLSIDAALMNEINRLSKLDKHINLSKMVENFLSQEFKRTPPSAKSDVHSLRGILKDVNAGDDWKAQKVNRLTKKYL